MGYSAKKYGSVIFILSLVSVLVFSCVSLSCLVLSDLYCLVSSVSSLSYSRVCLWVVCALVSVSAVLGSVSIPSKELVLVLSYSIF